MSKGRRTAWVLWMMAAGALPAYANNPPQADGMLSLILIFPAALLGMRWAGAQLTEKEKKWRVGKGALLAVAVFLTMGGTEIALIPLLILLFYGLVRGARIIQRGQGAKRIAIGIAVILLTVFAIGDYMLSLNNWSRTAMAESSAVGSLRSLVTAELTFQSSKTLNANRNEVGEFGTLEQLQEARLLAGSLTSSRGGWGYRYAVVLSGNPERDEKEFFAYAIPVEYGEEASWTRFVPGGSWMTVLQPRRHPARRSFAVDESGTIREADLGGSRPVTRAEAEKWPPLR